MELMKAIGLLCGLEEGGERGKKLGFRGETRQGVCDNILRGRDVGNAEAHTVPHQEGGLEVAQSTAGERDSGTLSGPCLTGCVVSTDEDHWVRVGSIVRRVVGDGMIAG